VNALGIGSFSNAKPKVIFAVFKKVPSCQPQVAG
jgi:hypothetical protein